MSNFNIGDKVKWCGVEGIIIPTHKNCILVKFNAVGFEHEIEFIHDGRYERWHTEPSLILVEKAKKKKKIKMLCYYGSEYKRLSWVEEDTEVEMGEIRVPSEDKEIEVEVGE